MKRDLSLAGLQAMDLDSDGEITLFEFLRFMLVHSELVDGETLDTLHAR